LEGVILGFVGVVESEGSEFRRAEQLDTTKSSLVVFLLDSIHMKFVDQGEVSSSIIEDIDA